MGPSNHPADAIFTASRGKCRDRTTWLPLRTPWRAKPPGDRTPEHALYTV